MFGFWLQRIQLLVLQIAAWRVFLWIGLCSKCRPLVSHLFLLPGKYLQCGACSIIELERKIKKSPFIEFALPCTCCTLCIVQCTSLAYTAQALRIFCLLRSCTHTTCLQDIILYKPCKMHKCPCLALQSCKLWVSQSVHYIRNHTWKNDAAMRFWSM